MDSPEAASMRRGVSTPVVSPPDLDGTPRQICRSARQSGLARRTVSTRAAPGRHGADSVEPRHGRSLGGRADHSATHADGAVHGTRLGQVLGDDLDDCTSPDRGRLLRADRASHLVHVLAVSPASRAKAARDNPEYDDNYYGLTPEQHILGDYHQVLRAQISRSALRGSVLPAWQAACARFGHSALTRSSWPDHAVVESVDRELAAGVPDGVEELAFGGGRESRSHIEAPVEFVEQRPCPDVTDRWMALARDGHQIFRQRLASAAAAALTLVFLLPAMSLLSAEVPRAVAPTTYQLTGPH
jgi:hypothetical protein